MKNKVKKAFWCLVVITTIIVCFALSVSAANYGGSCGDNARWEFDSLSKTLTISGTGKTTNYASIEIPWGRYNYSVENVIIEDGITGICDYAFADFINLKSINLGDGITELGWYTFASCSSLSKIVWGEKIEKIGQGVFWGCSSLEKIVIPNSVRIIDSEAFGSCNNLFNVTLGKKVETIGNRAFAYTDISEIVITDNVKKIGEAAFYNCQNLNSVVIGKNVKDVEMQTFAYCTFLETITIPKSVISIGESAFYFCKSLIKINYGGTSSDWKKISVSSGNSYMNYAVVNYNSLTTKKPAVTSEINVTQSTSTIKLSWKKVTDADGYRVYKYNSKTKKYEKVKDVTKTSIKISKLKAGTAYKFKVRAFKKNGKKTVWGEYSDVLQTATKTKAPVLSKLTAGPKQLTATWKTVSGATGYEVVYSTSKKFTAKTTKKVTIKKAKTKKTTIKKLKKGKKYYVKVRAYKTVSGKKLYGAWSSVKNVKVK